MTTVYYPQKKYLRGTSPRDLWLENDPMFNSEKTGVYAWCISTGIKVPYIFRNWNAGHPLIALGDDFEGEWKPRFELLLGEKDHETIVKKYGAQPLNTYLRGHFAWLPAPPSVIVQQYFLAGCWGDHPPNAPWAGTPTVKEQIAQNNIGIPLLFECEILREDTPILFADQSKPEQMLRDNRQFKGVDCLREYYPYLTEYLKKYRANDFNVPIEEVIACIPA